MNPSHTKLHVGEFSMNQIINKAFKVDLTNHKSGTRTTCRKNKKSGRNIKRRQKRLGHLFQKVDQIQVSMNRFHLEVSQSHIIMVVIETIQKHINNLLQVLEEELVVNLTTEDL
jgi:hypothetical protein